MDCMLWCFIHLCLWSHRDSEPSECCWRPDMHWCECVFLSECVCSSLLPTLLNHFSWPPIWTSNLFLAHLTKKADLCWLGEARQQIKASDSKSNTLSVKVSLSAPITRQKGGTRWWKGGYRTCRQGDPNWCAFLSFTITWINVYTDPHVFKKYANFIPNNLKFNRHYCQINSFIMVLKGKKGSNCPSFIKIISCKKKQNNKSIFHIFQMSLNQKKELFLFSRKRWVFFFCLFAVRKQMLTKRLCHSDQGFEQESCFIWGACYLCTLTGTYINID